MTVVTPSRGRSTVVIRRTVTWDPLAAPVVEDDTILLADFTSLATIQAQGGILSHGSHLAQNPADLQIGSGKFGPSIKPLGTNQATHVHYPIDGLTAGDEFTVEMWAMHPTLAWASVSNKQLFALRGAAFALPFGISGGGLSGYWQVYPAAPSDVTFDISTAFGGSLPAAVWHHVAMTLSADTVRVYVNGVLLKSRAGLPLLDAMSDDTGGGLGLMLGGTHGVASGFAISDLCVSRTARVPDTPVALRTLTGTVDINTASSAAAVRPNLLGTLHPPQFLGADPDQIGAAVKLMRTYSLTSATPIKAGGTDATHPTLGQSGLYSYDWQVVDRSVGYIIDLGSAPYLCLGGAPQILGGFAPYSGTDLTTKLSSQHASSYVLPNDLEAWAHIVSDFVHHIAVTQGWDVPLWSLWNEPELTSAPQRAAYIALYEATANAIRAIDPTAVVGGPEIAAPPTDYQTFITEWFTNIVVNDVPFDFFAYHEYTGDIGSFDNACTIVNDIATATGVPTPVAQVLGEFNWSNRLLRTPGSFDPFCLDFWHIRAFGAAYTAAFVAHALQRQEFAGFAYSHLQYNNPREGSYSATQLMSLDYSMQWAPYNAMVGLQMVLGDTRLTIATDLPPGVHAYAGRDSATGRVGVVLASFGWANRADRTVRLHLSGMTGDKRLRRWLVDPTHSSRWDTFEDDPAGSVDNDLELMEDRTASAALLRNLTVDVPQWSAVFLTLDPA